MPPSLDDGEFRTQNTSGQQVGVRRGEPLIVAAMHDQGGGLNGGQEIPGVVPFHCLKKKPDGILGNRDGLQFGLDQF